jgi:hypothetical protein
MWSSSGDWATDTTGGGEAVSPSDNTGTALLPLEVTAGNIYTISANLTATSGNWLALGFTQNDSTDNFTSDNLSAGPWLLLTPPSGDLAISDVYAVPGPATTDLSSAYTGGQGDNYKIVLNTTGTDWVATFYDGNTLLETYDYTGASGANPNPADNYVGLGAYNSTGGSVTSFLVTETSAPEPSAWSLIIGGGLSLIAFSRGRKVV